VGKHQYAVLDQELTFMAAGQGVLCRCRSQVSETICEAIDDELHLKGTENCCVNSDSHSVLGEEICDTPDFLISEQSALF